MADVDRKKQGGRQSGRPETDSPRGKTAGTGTRTGRGTAVEERDEQAFEGSVAPTGPGTGGSGAPSAGTQVFSCDRCTARFTDYHELMRHQSEAHGM